MKRLVALVLCSGLVFAIPTAYAAGSNIDGPAGVFMIILFLGIIGLALWAWMNPPSARQAKKEQKTREYNTNKAIAEASESNLGIVILSFQLGHPVTRYHDGEPYYYFLSGPDTVGGWTCRIKIINSCGKTIKYLTFNCTALNAVNDPASCKIGSSTNNLKGTGPINHGSTAFWEWERFVYSNDLNTMRIDSISVDYMDGTSEELNKDRIVWRNT